jgi:hypothetical protein
VAEGHLTVGSAVGDQHGTRGDLWDVVEG